LGLVAFPVNFNDPFEIGLVEVVESGKLALLIIANSIRKELSATSIPGCLAAARPLPNTTPRKRRKASYQPA
jgi:hypothetical protein